jgi:hypothetical protein
MLRDESWLAMTDLTTLSSILRLARYLSSEILSLASLHRGRDCEVCKFYRHLMHNASVSNLKHYHREIDVLIPCCPVL